MRFGLIFNFSADSLNDPANQQTKEKLGPEPSKIEPAKETSVAQFTR